MGEKIKSRPKKFMEKSTNEENDAYIHTLKYEWITY
jgi:hypothetical protein